jgi:hypothetical protein
LSLFSGLSTKAVHTTLQNFLYYFTYNYLKRHAVRLGLQSGLLTSTACGVAAGITNLTVTLPLDTLVVRVQSQEGDCARGVAHHAAELCSLGRAGLYSGFGVSCVLTLVPALTNSIYDGLKGRLSRARSTSLSTVEAFALGSIAKVLATIATYPLIRTKICMQSRRPKQPQANANSANSSPTGNGDSQRGTANGANRTRPPPPPSDGMVGTLLEIWRERGLEGLYAGLAAQIFTAVSKGGIMLASKEQVATYALWLLLLLRRPQRQLKRR